MERNDHLIEVLNDLVKINNDRIVGYEKAIDETKDLDVDLKAIFKHMAGESRRNIGTLTNVISKMGGEVSTNTTVSGKIYRVWMEVKASISGNDRHAILASCEFGEDAAQQAYKKALAEDLKMPSDIRQLIEAQQAALRSSHDRIKKYRDMQAAVK